MSRKNHPFDNLNPHLKMEGPTDRKAPAAPTYSDPFALDTIHRRLDAIERSSGIDAFAARSIAQEVADEQLSSVNGRLNAADRDISAALNAIKELSAGLKAFTASLKALADAVPQSVASGMEPVIDDMIALETRTDNAVAKASTSAIEARNAAASTVNVAETFLLGAARNFAHGE